MDSKFDVIVIGAGPAGYVAAIRCAQLGLKTACVDKWLTDDAQPSLGGTCLNVGCIPSKVLLESSELFDKIRHQSAAHGIHVQQATINVAEMMARKTKIVSELSQGIAALFRSHGIGSFHGVGTLLPGNQAGNQVSIQGYSKGETARVLQAKHVILAPGSSPVEIGAAPLQQGLIVDSSGGLSFTEVPQRLGIIGAGVIGLELGSVWRRLGAQVVLLEAQEAFLAMVDQQIARDALRQFTAQGLDIRLGARVVSSAVKQGKVDVVYQDKVGEHQLQFDALIVAVGRSPNTRGLSAEGARLLLDEWGFVHVDDYCQTNLPNVYAIGDVVRGPMLAHKGSEEGVMVAERIAGHAAVVNYDLIPSVIYTTPELAWVGLTEQAARNAGEPYRVGSFPFAANSRAKAHQAAQGLVKVVAHADTDRVLGVHIVGPCASELIMQAVVAMEFGASSEDIGLIMHAHPTLSEALREAALDTSGRAIHIARKKKI